MVSESMDVENAESTNLALFARVKQQLRQLLIRRPLQQIQNGDHAAPVCVGHKSRSMQLAVSLCVSLLNAKKRMLAQGCLPRRLLIYPVSVSVLMLYMRHWQHVLWPLTLSREHEVLRDG